MPMHDTSCYGILIVARPAYYVEGGRFKTGNESNREEDRMEREVAERTIRTDRREGRWRTTKFGLRSGAIGIRRRATSMTLPKVWESVRPFVPSAKLLPS